MNVAEYKEFIPYCIKSTVFSQHSTKRHDYMEAELQVGKICAKKEKFPLESQVLHYLTDGIINKPQCHTLSRNGLLEIVTVTRLVLLHTRNRAHVCICSARAAYV